jgi:hypothetical protein
MPNIFSADGVLYFSYAASSHFFFLPIQFSRASAVWAWVSRNPIGSAVE